MEKLQATQIFIKDANLKRVVMLSKTDATVIKLINETNRKQADLLKLKKIDQENFTITI